MSLRLLAVAALSAMVATPALAAPKFAKAALYYDGLSMVIRTGIKKVSHPSTGVYCIKRKFSGSAINEIALVTTEVDTSGGTDLLAHWAYGAGNCPNQDAWFEVRTYRLSGGNWVPANDVSFSFLVP